MHLFSKILHFFFACDKIKQISFAFYEVYMMKIGVAVSGGVDSSVAAYLLKNQGFDVICIYMRLGESDDSAAAAKAAEALGLPLYIADLRREFDEKVKSYFASAYMKGETPNPCVVCNKHIKFGSLLLFAESLGCRYLATGHYARTDGKNIKKSLLPDKDQSYCLWMLERDVIGKIMFPLGDIGKTQVRAIAEEAGLPSAHQKDSQDICFVPDGDYRKFLKEYLQTDFVGGSFLDTDGRVLGHHEGIQCYTVGQRKGLGVSADRPLYVIKKDAAANTVILGDDTDLFTNNINLRDVNINFDAAEELDANVKIRFRASDAPAHIRLCGGKTAVVSFEKKVRAPACGQSAVFYIGDTLVGGGIIV